MTTPVSLSAQLMDLDACATLEGRIALLVDGPDALDAATRRVNRLTKGAVARLLASDRFSKLKPGETVSLAFPAGLQAEAVDIVRLPRRATLAEARKAGVGLAKLKGKAALTVMAGTQRHAADAAPFGHDCADFTIRRQRPNAAVQNVTIDQAAFIVPDQALDQAITTCQFFHGLHITGPPFYCGGKVRRIDPRSPNLSTQAARLALAGRQSKRS